VGREKKAEGADPQAGVFIVLTQFWRRGYAVSEGVYKPFLQSACFLRGAQVKSRGLDGFFVAGPLPRQKAPSGGSSFNLLHVAGW